MDSILEIQDLSIGRQTAIIQHIECNVREAGVIILTGVNGAGKSTLLKTIAGLISPLAGTININGKPLKQLDAKQLSHLIAFVGTGRMNEDFITAREMISFARFPYGQKFWQNKDIDANVTEAIQMMQIESIAEKYLHTLSDGEWQKANVARALAQDTPIILMDEPTAFLDYPSKVQLLKNLKAIALSKNKLMILSTHDVDLAAKYGTVFWHIEKQKFSSSDKNFDWQIDL